MKRPQTMLLATSALLLTSALSQGAVTVTYDFTTNLNSTTSGATAAISASGATHSNGAFTGGASTPARSSGQHMFVRSNATGTAAVDGDTLAEAVTNNAYTSFIITNNGTDSIQINNFSFDVFDANGATWNVALMNQSAGFTEGDEFASVTLGPTQVLESAPINSSTNLSINLAAGSTEEFRLYFFDDADGAGNVIRYDNVVITADAVPEPSSTALLGLGGLALILRRRK